MVDAIFGMSHKGGLSFQTIATPGMVDKVRSINDRGFWFPEDCAIYLLYNKLGTNTPSSSPFLDIQSPILHMIIADRVTTKKNHGQPRTPLVSVVGPPRLKRSVLSCPLS